MSTPLPYKEQENQIMVHLHTHSHAPVRVVRHMENCANAFIGSCVVLTGGANVCGRSCVTVTNIQTYSKKV